MKLHYIYRSFAIIIVIMQVLTIFFIVIDNSNFGSCDQKIIIPNKPLDSPSGVDWWSKFGHDLNDTGFTSSKLPNQWGVIWNYTGATFSTCPAVVDGRIFVGTDAGSNTFYCLNENNGSLIWQYSLPGYVHGTPAVYSSKVYFGTCTANEFYCLWESNGTLVWMVPQNNLIYSSPAVYENKVYFGSLDKNIYCLNANNGSLIWNKTTGNGIHGSPAIANNTVFIGSTDGNLYAYNASSGAQIWSRPFSGGVYNSPLIANNTIYEIDINGKIMALYLNNGTVIWSKTLGGTRGSFALGYGMLFYYSSNSKLYAINKTNGADIWNKTIGSSFPVPYQITPSIADERVILGSASPSNKVFILNTTTGKQILNQSFPGAVLSTPSIANGRVFIGCWNGKIYSLGDNVKPTVKSYSPKGTWVFLGRNITVNFSEPMDRKNTSLAFSISPSVLGNITWNSTGIGMTFKPLGFLAYDMNYTVSINSTAKDQFNNSLVPFSWNFSTEKELSYIFLASGDKQKGDVDKNLTLPLTVRVTNSISTPKNYRRVNWTITKKPANAILQNITSFSYTNSTGYAVAILHLGLVEGNYTVHADALGDFVRGNITFNATAYKYQMNYYSGNKQQNITSTNIPMPLSVKITNSTGIPVPNRLVNWSIIKQPTGAKGTKLTANYSYSNSTGLAWSYLVLGDKFGNYSVKANGTKGGAPFTYTFNETAVPHKFLPFSGDKQSDITNVTLAYPFVISVQNSTGVPIPGINVTWKLASTPASAKWQYISAKYSITNASGLAEVYLHLGDKFGIYSVYANTSSKKVIDNYTFTAAANLYHLNYYSGDNQYGIINSTIELPLIVKATNLTGAAVSGRLINWTIAKYPVGSKGQYLVNNYSITNATGYASTIVYLGDTFGNYSIKAAGLLSGTTENYTFNESAVPYDLQYYSGDNQVSKVLTDTPTPLVVKIVNPIGRPMQGYYVNWTIILAPPGSKGHFLWSNDSFTNVSGIAATMLHLSNRSGTYKILAKAQKYCIFGTYTFTITAAADSPNMIVINPQYKTLAVDESYDFNATTFDVWGNIVPISGYNWSCTGGFINATGNFTAGNHTAMDNVYATLGSAVNGSAIVKIVPGKPARIEIAPSNTVITSDMIANFSATTYDKYTNILNYSVNWELANGNSGFIGITGTYYPDKAGNWTIYANITSIPLSAKTNVTVVPGRMTSLNITGTRTVLNVTEKADFIATAYDLKGNYISNVSAIWSTDAGNLTVTGVKSCEITAGTKTMIGFVNATVGTFNESLKLTVNPGAVVRLLLPSFTNPLKSNDLRTYSGFGEDLYGNKVTNIVLKFTLTSNLGTLSLGSNYCVLHTRNIDGIYDSDRDMIPDNVDPYPYNYNNDGVLDSAKNHAIGSDGLVDFPWGSQHFINTTVPAKTPIPSEYQNQNVSIYVDSSGAYYTGFVTCEYQGLIVQSFVKVTIPSSGFTGIVKDSSGKPLKDCQINGISKVFGNFTTFTNSSGMFIVQHLPFGSYNLTFEKSGYSTVSMERNLSVTDWEYINLEGITLTVVKSTGFQWSSTLVWGITIALILVIIIVILMVVVPRVRRSKQKSMESSMIETELLMQRNLGIDKRPIDKKEGKIKGKKGKHKKKKKAGLPAESAPIPATTVPPDQSPPLPPPPPPPTVEQKLPPPPPPPPSEKYKSIVAATRPSPPPVSKKEEEKTAVLDRTKLEEEWKKLEEELLTNKSPRKEEKKTYFQEKDDWLDDNVKKLEDEKKIKEIQDEKMKKIDELKKKLDELDE